MDGKSPTVTTTAIASYDYHPYLIDKLIYCNPAYTDFPDLSNQVLSQLPKSTILLPIPQEFALSLFLFPG
ncbi:MAG: hypothetical protein QXP38_08420 [Nitrososphaerota archaeon]